MFYHLALFDMDIYININIFRSNTQSSFKRVFSSNKSCLATYEEK